MAAVQQVAWPTENCQSLFEHTIRNPVSTRGIGLHYGVDASVRLMPAKAGTGLVFVRTDLDDFEIPASWRHVAKLEFATRLLYQGVFLSTTEHLLSALYALGIDNVRIEIDNLEVPIKDGSSRAFADMLSQAGFKRQRRKRRYMRIRKRVEVADSGKCVSIEPAEGFSVQCETFFPHPMVGDQRLAMAVTPEAYLSGVAPARTFGFESELAAMRDAGLIRGGSLENAVCFADSGAVLNDGGLRFADEPCRHKCLDLIGDLSLVGHPLIGRVVATCGGHAMHVALVRRIVQDPDNYEIVTLDQMEPSVNGLDA